MLYLLVLLVGAGIGYYIGKKGIAAAAATVESEVKKV